MKSCKFSMALKKTPLAGVSELWMGKKLKKGEFRDFSSSKQALGFVFHNIVERPVDKFVDNLRKCAVVTILHQIA
jgi:hypothetical protein